MDVKKISLAVLIFAAFISAAMAAATTDAQAPVSVLGSVSGSGLASTLNSDNAGGPTSASGPGDASSPGPAPSGASETLPVLGSMIGASLVSFLAYFLQ